jgi:hypothetical protein
MIFRGEISQSRNSSDPVQVSGKGTFEFEDEFEFEDKSEDGSRS